MCCETQIYDFLFSEIDWTTNRKFFPSVAEAYAERCALLDKMTNNILNPLVVDQDFKLPPRNGQIASVMIAISFPNNSTIVGVSVPRPSPAIGMDNKSILDAAFIFNELKF